MTPESILNAANQDVAKAIEEDIGSGDASAALIHSDSESEGTLITRADGVFCGRPWVNEVVNQIGGFSVDWRVEDGDRVQSDQVIATFHGRSRSILTAERTMLNFAQTLSGTATITRTYCDQISHTQTKLLDTRKTLPGLRIAQKYAVSIGGGCNHRIGLFDAFLIKENHIAAAGSIETAVTSARTLRPELFLEVEVETIAQLAECVKLYVPRVLLDNFTLDQTSEAVQRFGEKIELEASGDVSLSTIKAIAETGVHYISSGALTKHVHALDLSLRFNDTDIQ